MPARKKFYVTTPIYYVNDKPHIGHAYTTIVADVLTRFHRLRGDATFFLTGTDEHGQKVQQAAERTGISPQAHCDQMVEHFRQAWEKLNIKYDYFIRTTDKEHQKAVQSALDELYAKGEIYLAEYGGYYCVGCERFYTRKELVEGKCPQHLQAPDYIKEKNYFFRMGKYQEWLIEYIHQHPEFIQPESRRNEVLGFLKNPLGDLCISRPKSRLQWGIELPFDPDYVTYVWFDALLNYITAVGYKQQQENFTRWWPADYHLIGKDIVTTHCVYWPTMLKALGLPLPRTILAHGWWLVAETKMSKSLQNIIKPLDLVDTYGVDAVRYFLMRDMILGQDANFSLDSFIKRYNSELANDLGNLVSRIGTLIIKNFPTIPEPSSPSETERKIEQSATALPDTVMQFIDAMRLSDALEAVISFVRELNRFMELRQPWHLVKTDRTVAGTVLYTALEGLRITAQLLQPVMPSKMKELLDKIPVTEADNPFNWGKCKSGVPLTTLPILFPRIENQTSTTKAPVMTPEIPSPEQISITDFGKIKLVTAKIITAESIPNANKLLKLQVDTGTEKRQIVAGIAEYFQPENLVGKTIILVANLQPAQIRGIRSEGMLLAAKKDGHLTLLTTMDDIGPGAIIS